MSICDINNICKYGKNHRLEQCRFCELEIRVKVIEEELPTLKEVQVGVITCKEKIEKILGAIKGISTRPHKCPVCKGDGRINLKVPFVHEDHTFYSISCVPCEGKGIVWG